MNIEQTLMQWHEGQGKQHALLRALATHDQWLLPRTPTGSFAAREDDDGRPFLTMFHSAEAEAEYSVNTGHGIAHRGVMAGYAAFIGLLDQVQGVDIDPNTPLAMHFKADQLDALRHWGRTIQVEKALTKPGEVEGDPLVLIRNFRGYRVVVADRGEGEEVALAPDTRGRRLMAVFTALDAVELYAAKNPHRVGSSWRVLTFSGEKLFSTLKEREHDGIVFNCNGPEGTIAAFQRAFATEVLAHVPT